MTIAPLQRYFLRGCKFRKVGSYRTFCTFTIYKRKGAVDKVIGEVMFADPNIIPRIAYGSA